jgi:hypothetical protein
MTADFMLVGVVGLLAVAAVLIVLGVVDTVRRR